MKYTLLFISTTLLLFFLFGHIDSPMSIFYIILSGVNYSLCAIPGWFIVTGILGAVFAASKKHRGYSYINGVGQGMIVSPPFLILCECAILAFLQRTLWYFPTFEIWQMMIISTVRIGIMVLTQMED